MILISVKYLSDHGRAVLTRHLNAEHFRQLREEDVQGGTGGEAGDQRVGDVIGEKGEPTNAHHHLNAQRKVVRLL